MPPDPSAGATTATRSTPAPPPATGGKIDGPLIAAAAVVILGSIMSILDVTVVNVAINTLAQEFSVSLTTIQWVATGYTLALATVIPLTAWAAERFGTKRVYLVSIGLFVVGSLLAGIAWDATSLIVFRVLQGFGGGMIMPIGMIILTRAAGPGRIGRVMSVIGIPTLLGPIGGPILGGWLVDEFSWRWIFFINLPIGLIAMALAWRLLPRDTIGTRRPLDYIGVALLSPGLALLIFGLAESGAAGGFGHWQSLVPTIAGVVLFATFVWHALRSPAPLIDLRLFTNKVFAGSIATMFLMVIAVFGGMLLLPLYLQLVRGEGALETGLLLAPQGLGAVVAMPLAGMLADRTGVGRIVPAGLAVIAAAMLWMTGLGPDTSYVTLSIVLFVMGIGMGFTMMPTFTGAMQSLRRVAIPAGSTILNITQQVAASFGTAVLTVILTAAMAANGGSGGAIGELAALPPDVFATVRPLLAAAFGSTYWWAFGLVATAVVVSLAVLPQRKPAIVDDGEDDGAVPPAVMH